MDEVHIDAKLSGSNTSTTSKTQYKVAFDPTTCKLKSKSDGGVMPANKVRAVEKYGSQAKVMFMCACPKDDNDIEYPQMLDSWWYTNQWVLSIEDWDERVELEYKYRREMESMGWKPYTGENPYIQRYGPNAPDCPPEYRAGINPETGRLYWKEKLENSSGQAKKGKGGAGLKKYV